MVGALFVGRIHELFGRFGSQPARAHEPFDAVLARRRDEDVDAAGMFAQDVVGAAAHEDARLALGQLADHVALHLEQRVVAQRVVVDRVVARERTAQIAEQGGEEPLGRLFVGLFEEFLAEAAVFGGHLDEPLVVDGDAETLGQPFADGLAAAAELTSDVDDEFFVHGRVESLNLHSFAEAAQFA